MSDRIAAYERRRNGLPSGRPASGPVAKRIALSPWTWLAVGLTLIYVACLLYQYALVTQPTPTASGAEVPGLNWPAIRDSAKLAFPTLAFWIVAYLLYDRFRPQRLLLWWLALGWGGSVATAASLVINTWAARQMQIGGQDPSAGARSAIFVAPFVEEATKASILFFIAIAYRYRLVSKVSGITLAGLSAAGFAFTENIIYYARAIVYSSVTIGTGDPQAAVEQVVRMRGLFLAFGHPLFTTATGVGVLVAVRTHSKLVRVLAPLVGFLIAALGHMAFNTGATILQTKDQQYLVYFAMVLPLVLGVVIWVIRQLLGEGRRLRARLSDFARFGWLSDGDVYAFSRVRTRARAVLIAATHGWRCLMATLALQRAVTELAYLRDAQTLGTVDAAGDARAVELLARIAEVRPEAIIDPRGRRLNLPDLRGALGRLRDRLPGRGRPAPELQPNLHATTGAARLGSAK